jgi:(p)ppGpp synthase/HD superfamily hydrolase
MEKNISPELFKKILDFAYDAYQNKSKRDTLRQGGKTPFITHPYFAASLLLADRRVPWEDRYYGYQILILHDVLEDTDADLPDWLEDRVVQGVKDMTFSDDISFEEKGEIIKNRDPFIKLLELCDTISNVYEEHVGEKKRSEWKELDKELVIDVENIYGDIRVVQLSKAILDNTDW